MVIRLNRPVLFAAVVCSICLGCGSDPNVEVTGTVTFDGQPVEQGAISFVSVGKEVPSQGAVIESGKFQARLTPGNKRVEIRASRPVKPNPRDPDSARMREDFLPARYNTATTLTAEISADQENKLRFELSSR